MRTTNQNKRSGRNRRAVNVRKQPRTSAFRPVREGTFRATLLRSMDGTKTPEQLAELGQRSRSLVMSHAYCLYRDCGIGYGLTKDGSLVAILPRNKTLQDAVRA